MYLLQSTIISKDRVLKSLWFLKRVVMVISIKIYLK